MPLPLAGNVTFQVDMAQQIQLGVFNPNTMTVEIIGQVNGWADGAGVLTNDPTILRTNQFNLVTSNVYVGTFPNAGANGSPGEVCEFKYRITGGLYESVGPLNGIAQNNENRFVFVSANPTLDANGAQLAWKFTTSNLGFETTASGPAGINRTVVLPATSGSSLVLPVEWFSDAGSPVAYNCVFQVNMQEQIALGNFNPGTQTVEVQGDFEGWTTGDTLIQEGSSTIYTNTFFIAGSPGQVNEFLYFIQPTGAAESIGLPDGVLNGLGFNRFVFVEPNQTLPVVYFSDQVVAPTVTNNVAFSVDMTAQVFTGAFTNNTVTLRGQFNGWSTTSLPCTNNPSASNTNIYSCVVSNLVSPAGSKEDFKWGFNPNSANNSYENNPSHTYAGPPSVYIDGNNRAFKMPDINNSTVTLPTVYYNDLSPSSVLPAPPLTNFVTFSVNMTNAVGTDAHVFNPSTDSVYLNGLDTTNSLGIYSFDAWTNNPTGNPLGNFLMQNNPLGSEIYTITVPIPAGYPVMVSYKYAINGNDDEAGFATNHVRYIRFTGSYALPQDTFGSMIQEQSFGNLAIGPKSGANVPITWLGRPGVQLQVTTNLTTGSWSNVSGSNAQNATNYPASSGASYFRLINPF